MGGQEVVVHAWKEWGIRALVLLSFTLQVVLLVLAEIRRRVRSGTLMFFLWSAYMLADSTAIYVLGHMSVTSRSAPEHQLVAFWAPFLLLHLGGQDNITAYAIEDNRLWLRHLQALAVQVAAAAYVLYESSIITGGQTLLRWATILMFLVGAVKYGERVLALRLASRSAAGNNYLSSFHIMSDRSSTTGDMLLELVSNIPEDAKGCKGARDTEAHIVMAHRMLDVPNNILMKGLPYNTKYELRGARLYKVVEMQISLVHDMFYTKTEIIHSNWPYGLCTRTISAVVTAASCIMFHILVRNDHHKDATGYNRVDVAITYVLLAGAVVLETLSLLRTTFSSWAFSQSNVRLAGIVFYVRQLVHAASWRGRGWSASMGQHNLLQLSARSRASRSSKMARWMGLEDPWNTVAYSWSIPVSAFIEEKLMDRLSRREQRELERKREMRMSAAGGEEEGDEEEREEDVVVEVNEMGPDSDLVEEEDKEALVVWDLERRPVEEPFELRDLFVRRVPEKLKRWSMYTFCLNQTVEERVLAWHIATNIYLTWWHKEHQQTSKVTAEAVEALSNYMVFLLAARPDMMSPTGSRRSYVDMCYALATNRRPECETADQLAGELGRYGDGLLNYRGTEPRNYGFHGYHLPLYLPLTLDAGCMLGAMLIRKHAEDTLDAIAQAWVETLYDAAQGCSGYAHAKQLSNGGELITVAAILVQYVREDRLL